MYTIRHVAPEHLAGDLVKENDPRYGLIWINPERMSGAPCFFGTRVPVQILWDYLEAGDTVEVFLEQYPGVTRDQVIGVIEQAGRYLLQGLVAP